MFTLSEPQNPPILNQNFKILHKRSLKISKIVFSKPSLTVNRKVFENIWFPVKFKKCDLMVCGSKVQIVYKKMVSHCGLQAAQAWQSGYCILFDYFAD